MRAKVEHLGNVTLSVDDWYIENSYPARCITTNYGNWTTYVSRKAVPANTPITDINYWKPIARLDQQILLDYDTFKKDIISRIETFGLVIQSLNSRINDIETQMQSFLATASGGQAFSNKYGDSEVMGVTQKALTETVNGLYGIIFDNLGLDVDDVQITITPDSFFKNEAAIVNITAIADYGMLDFVKVYFNGEKVLEQNSVKTFSENLTIDRTTTIRVEAQLLGKLSTYEKTVTMASDFFIGSGDTYEDVYNPIYSVPYNGDPTGNYTVEVAEGQRIIIILPTEDVSKIEQIEMNDFNIPMTTTVFGIYTVYTSVNVYQAGTYRIDINY